MRYQILAAATLNVMSAAACATDYLTVAQAQRLIYPNADGFEQKAVALNPQQLQAVARQAQLPARSAQWIVWVARQQDQALGVVVVDQVVGKFELITYAVGIDQDGNLRQLEVLSYRESHGGEIRLSAWRKQFVGKTLAAPLRVGADIVNVSGATMSCSHVTDGVRRIMAMVAVAKTEGLL